MNVGTRNEIKKDIKKGYVKVDGKIISDASFPIFKNSTILYKNEAITYEPYQYFIVNKPSGYISATSDKNHKVVTDLLKGNRKDIFPVGRLDIDTEGLLLITNDGELSHFLLSPKNHVQKTYFAKILGNVKDSDILTFNEGFYYDENLKALPSKLSILKRKASDESTITYVNITICEGKFHQIKKMFKALGYEVLYLKRISFGSLFLPEDLNIGEYKKLTEEEVNNLKNL